MLITKLHTKRCEFCPAGRDDANHTIFFCEACSYLREEVERRLGKSLTMDTLVESMLLGREEWQWIESIIDEIMSHKEDAERRRQSALVVVT
ncbi:hypothetical protein P5V15_012673 [Pogonomyrmex californicus]